MHEQVVPQPPLHPPPPQTPQWGEKHINRVSNMLYIGYLMIWDGHNIKKIPLPSASPPRRESRLSTEVLQGNAMAQNQLAPSHPIWSKRGVF